MKPHEINALIAKSRGWTILEPEVCPAITYYWGYPPGITSGNRSMIPEYFNDLNDMHVAEESLTPGQLRAMFHIIRRELGFHTSTTTDTAASNVMKAPASIRAHAFLKVLKIIAYETNTPAKSP